jgi:archaellum component FlaF (FlaF/FlaG flagellin family)
MLNKKGISNQVATVLLIGFVIALLVIVFLWGKNYIQERAEKQGKLAEKQLDCENLKIEVVNVFQQGNTLKITLKNTKEQKIEKFIFRVIGTGDVFSTESFDVLESLSIKQYTFDYPEDQVSQVTNVDIIPWLRVARGYFVPCSQKHINAKVLLQ